MLLIGTKIPEFTVKAIIGGEFVEVSDKDLLGSYTLLFFYANDFSPVCPSELHALQDNMGEFDKRKVRVIAISVDSNYTHKKFLSTPPALSGIKGAAFALVSDMSQRLSKAFKFLDAEHGCALRASFLVDEENIIQYGSANSVAFGRSIRELLRLIDAIQLIKSGVPYCPGNWHPDKQKT